MSGGVVLLSSPRPPRVSRPSWNVNSGEVALSAVFDGSLVGSAEKTVIPNAGLLSGLLALTTRDAGSRLHSSLRTSPWCRSAS